MVRKLALLKPRFGIRRSKGIWPPSNPRRIEPPERAVWPLPPRPPVLPCPELSPMPRRFVRCLAPGRGFKLCNRIVILAYPRCRLPRETAHPKNLLTRTQLQQRIDCRLYNVHGIAGTHRFRQHVTHAGGLDYRTHAATGDDAGT